MSEVMPLMRRFPGLPQVLPRVCLTELPTPVQRLDRLASDLGIENLYIKRDDCTGVRYGGNKPRKLEFLLAAALSAGATHVLTYGAAGSNHALATAVYAERVGLKCISLLMSQPNATYVGRNLLMAHKCGAELHACGGSLESAATRLRMTGATVRVMARHRLRTGRTPVRIPPGGSSALGTVGYVNAALELADQIGTGELPEPDVIYVACGTLGTAAGIMYGLQLAGLRSHIVGVQVTTGTYVNDAAMIRLADQTGRLLHSMDNSVPCFACAGQPFEIRKAFCGPRYAAFTREGMAAVRLVRDVEGVKLDGTYTGKTFAALIHDAAEARLRRSNVLFWNTLNSRDFSDEIKGMDYRALPGQFHRYFEEPVQPLDQA